MRADTRDSLMRTSAVASAEQKTERNESLMRADTQEQPGEKPALQEAQSRRTERTDKGS
jgi:hypothetical protein